MIIEVDKIPEESLSISRDFEFPGLELIEEETVFLSPAHVEAVVRKIGDEVLIKGRLTARLSFVCGRCLSPFEYNVDSKFDLVFLPEELDVTQDELGDDDVDSVFYRDRRLDLHDIVLEQLNLTIPLKPLCSESCEGICAVCGQLRREGHCACHEQRPDVRLDKLKYFVRDKS